MKDYNIAAFYLTECYPEILRKKENASETGKSSRELRYIEWKYDLIDVTLRERLGNMERPIFRLIYGKRMTFREVKEVYLRNTGQRLLSPKIVKAKRRIMDCLAMEIQFRDTYELERANMNRFFSEVDDWFAIPKNQRKIPKRIIGGAYGERETEGETGSFKG